MPSLKPLINFRMNPGLRDLWDAVCAYEREALQIADLPHSLVFERIVKEAARNRGISQTDPKPKRRLVR